MIVFFACVLVISSSGSSIVQNADDSLYVRFVGQYDTPGVAYHVEVHGSYAYVADLNGGLRIIDVSNPASPFEVGYCDSASDIQHVSVEGTYAYVGGRYQCLDIINVQNPASPFIEGTYIMPISSGIFNISIVQPYAFCISSNYCPSPQSLRAIDISTPTNPAFIDSSLAGQGSGMHQGLVNDGDYAYVSSYSAPEFLVFDISDVNNMHEVASCSLPNYFPHDMQQKDSLLFAACMYDGVEVINVSDPLSPQIIEIFQCAGSALGIAIDNNLAYVSARDSGLRVLNITDPTQIEEVGFHDTPSYAYDVYYQSPYIYVACHTEGLVIYEFMPTGTEHASTKEPMSFFTVLQNPVKGKMIEVGYHGTQRNKCHFSFYDACGRSCGLQYKAKAGSGDLQFDVSPLQSGIYFLACSQGNEVVQIEKVVLLE